MSKMEEIFQAEGKIIAGTLKSVKFDFDAVDEEIWIPLSQIHDSEELFDQQGLRIGAQVTVKMTAWIAKKVGLR